MVRDLTGQGRLSTAGRQPRSEVSVAVEALDCSVHVEIVGFSAVAVGDRTGVAVTDRAVRPHHQGREHRLVLRTSVVCDGSEHLANPVTERDTRPDTTGSLNLFRQLLVGQVGAVGSRDLF